MKRYSFIPVASFAAFALALDQTTKAVMLVVMQPPRLIPVTPFFNLTLGFNEGTSFGMLGGLMQGRPWAMIALTAAITAFVGVWALRAQTETERAGFSLVVGGALGNILDRIRQGAVTDFLDFYWKDWHWPTFNMANVTIFIGAMLILSTALPRRLAQVRRSHIQSRYRNTRHHYPPVSRAIDSQKSTLGNPQSQCKKPLV